MLYWGRRLRRKKLRFHHVREGGTPGLMACRRRESLGQSGLGGKGRMYWDVMASSEREREGSGVGGDKVCVK